MERQRPQWPSAIPSLDHLLQYLQTSQPIALFNAKVNTDFRSPRRNWVFDSSAYTTEDGTQAFTCLVFGHVKNVPSSIGGHCTFVLDCGATDMQAACDAFEAQIELLTDLVGEDDKIDLLGSASIRVVPWTDADRTTQSGGLNITMHTTHAGGTRCVVYTPTDEVDVFDMDQPQRAVDYPFKAGDWVVASVTLHRRESEVQKVRSYELLARHIRVFPAGMLNTEPVPLLTGSGGPTLNRPPTTPTASIIPTTAAVSATPVTPPRPSSTPRSSDSPSPAPPAPATPPRPTRILRGYATPAPTPPSTSSAPNTRSRTSQAKRARPTDASTENLLELKTPRKRPRREPSLPTPITSPDGESSTAVPVRIRPPRQTARMSTVLSIGTQGREYCDCNEKAHAALIHYNIPPPPMRRLDLPMLLPSAQHPKPDLTEQLPAELLSAIAEEVVAPETDPWYNVAPARLTIALVSKRWKAVVYDHAALWRTITVHQCTPALFLETSLKQSKQYSLVVIIDGHPNTHLPTGDAIGTMRPVRQRALGYWVDDVLEVMRKDFARVQSLHMQFAEHQLWRTVMRVLCNYAARDLETLHCSVRQWDTDIVEVNDEDDPLQLPRWIGGPHISAMDAQTIIPVWSNAGAYAALTVLKLFAIHEPVTWVHLRTVLQHAIHLQILVVREVVLHGTEDGASVILPALRDFHIQHSGDGTVAIASKLSMPMLHLLGAGAYSDSSIYDLYDANPSLFHNSPHIEIGTGDYDTTQLVPLLGQLRSAQHLDLRRCDYKCPAVLLRAIEDTRLCLPMVTCLQVPGILGATQASSILNVCAVNCRIFSRVLASGVAECWWMEDDRVRSQIMSEPPYNEPWDYLCLHNIRLAILALRSRILALLIVNRWNVLTPHSGIVDVGVLVAAVKPSPGPLSNILPTKPSPHARVQYCVEACRNTALGKAVSDRSVPVESFLVGSHNRKGRNEMDATTFMGIRAAGTSVKRNGKTVLIEKIDPLLSVQVGSNNIQIVGYARVALNAGDSERNGSNDPTACPQKLVEERVEFRGLRGHARKTVVNRSEEGRNVSGDTAA
ncbi:hypothetical protein B0H11DRAFT_1930437 [Mycena galericulata]|nr:hypothetical protein B0H11DRAFT_1930437 [Mycena galericulata]